MSDISVSIETLALDIAGAQFGDGHYFARMTEAALQRLLEQQGLPPGLSAGDAPEIVIPHLDSPPGITDHQRAEELALSIYSAINAARL